MTSKPWILFDIGGVLEAVDDGLWQQRFAQSLRTLSGLDNATYGMRVDAAALPRADVETGVESEYWRRLGAALGFDDETRTAVRAQFWDSYCGVANTELLDYAMSLPARVGRAALSNSMDGAREQEENRFGLSRVVDPICYSHEIGAAKPEAASYAAALAAMEADAGDVLFIDDHQVSLDGAAAVGIRGVLHTDNATTIAAIEDFLAPYAQ